MYIYREFSAPSSQPSSTPSPLTNMVEYYPLKTLRGSLSDATFNHPGNGLVYPVNAVACDAHGLTGELHSLYNFAKVYARRRRLYHLARAVRDDRDPPGTIVVERSQECDTSPHLIALVLQYAWGPPLEDNQLSESIMKTTLDCHYAQGLKDDTKANRLEYFKTCVKKLTIFAMGCHGLERLLIPAGIGLGGRTDQEWEDKYIPILQGMASRLQSVGVEVVLLKNK